MPHHGYCRYFMACRGQWKSCGCTVSSRSIFYYHVRFPCAYKMIVSVYTPKYLSEFMKVSMYLYSPKGFIANGHMLAAVTCPNSQWTLRVTSWPHWIPWDSLWWKFLHINLEVVLCQSSSLCFVIIFLNYFSLWWVSQRRLWMSALLLL